MSRARKSAQQRAQQEVERRRNSAAHRSLRRRAAKGKGAATLGQTPAETPETATPTTDDAPVTPDATHDSVEGHVGDEAVPAWLAESESVEDAPADDLPVEDVADEEAAVEDGPVAEGPVDEAPATTGPLAGYVIEDSPTEYVPSAYFPAQEDSVEEDIGDEPAVHEPDVDDTAADHTAADDTAVLDAPVEDTAVFESVAQTSTLPPAAPAAAPSEPATPPYAFNTPAGPEHSASVEEPADEQEHSDRPKKGRKAWIIPLVIVFLGVLYAGAQALLSNTVPNSTETMGIAIGGMSASQAEGEVAAHASALKAADLEMKVADQVFMLPAADAGLDIDAQATVAQVTGFTLAPDRLWSHIVGGGELEPVIVVDEEALAGAMESAAAHFDGPAQDAGVKVEDGAVEVVPGRFAVTVDQEGSAALIAEQWPLSESFELVAEAEAPAITDENAEAFAQDLESQTFSAAVTLEGDDAQAVIEPETIASHSTVITGPNGLELEVDGQGLTQTILEANPELSTDGKNASVSFDDNHDIVIDEGTPGITIDGSQLGQAVLVAAQSSSRVGELPYTAADPEISAEDLGLADFKEIISSFDSPLTSEWVRTENLRTAAASVEGVILQPGDTFDLTEVLSPINAEAGYRASGVIVNGILTQGMGGGLSQMATNAYNAGYFAGFELIEHRPHSVWFTRYPAGRESTMYTGSINVVFKNNTPYAAVLNSYVDGGRLHTDVWSTRHFEVETVASPRTNVRQPGVKEVTSANCRAKSAGQPGFTITNTRTVLLEGEEVDSNSSTWTYAPDDAIRCVSPDDNRDEDNDE